MNKTATIAGKVAVIGANGFVGGRVLESFRLRGVASLAAVVRGPGSLTRLARFEVDWRLADAADETALAAALKGCELAVHAVVGDAWAIAKTAAVLIPAAMRAGVRRVVYLSTASVHGLAPAVGTDESSVLSDRQDFVYNNAKVRAERRLFADASARGVELIVLRPSVVFGLRDQWATPLAEELQRGAAWLVEEGCGICNSVYVDNLVHAVELALRAPREACGQAYLITDDEAVTWRRFHETLRELIGATAPVLLPSTPVFSPRGWRDRIGDLRATDAVQAVLARTPDRAKRMAKAVAAAWADPRRQADDAVPGVRPRLDRERVSLQKCGWRLPCAAAKRALGYAPVVSFDEGMRRTAAWLRWAGLVGEARG